MSLFNKWRGEFVAFLALILVYLPLHYMILPVSQPMTARFWFPLCCALVIFFQYVLFKEHLYSIWRSLLLGLLAGYLAGVASLILMHGLTGSLFSAVSFAIRNGHIEFVLGYFITPVFLMTPVVGAIVFVAAKKSTR